MTESHAGAEDSPLVRELRLLLDALVDRGEPLLDRFAGEGAGRSSAEPATCQWCPLCAALALVRGERSELVARAGEQAAGLVAVLREFIESGAVPPHGAPEPETARPPAPRVVRIPVRGAETGGGPRDGGLRAPAGRGSAPPPSGRVQHIEVRRRAHGDEPDRRC